MHSKCNLKDMEKILGYSSYLSHRKILTFGSFNEYLIDVNSEVDSIKETISAKEKRVKETTVLTDYHKLKPIFDQYSFFKWKGRRDLYVDYRKSGYSKKLFEAHREEITLHKASKTAFSRIPDDQKIGGKLPTIKRFSQGYGQILAEKKRLYKEYREAGEERKNYIVFPCLPISESRSIAMAGLSPLNVTAVI